MCMLVPAFVTGYTIFDIIICVFVFSDVWALGCVLYELATLKHAVSSHQYMCMGTHN